MTGLLDFLQTPAGQGLLAAGVGYAANARKGAPLNSLGAGGLMGLQAYSGAQQSELEKAERAQTAQYRDVQMQNLQSEIAARNQAAEAARLKREAGANAFQPPVMTGGQAAPQTEGGIPFFSKPMGVTPVQQAPAGVNVQALLKAGWTHDEIKGLDSLRNLGMEEVARTAEVDDGQGGKMTVQLDKFGRPVGKGMPGYVPPVQVNQGDRVSFVRPAAGVNLPVNMSPEAKASNALGWANHGLTRRGQDMTDARARETTVAGKVPAGYRMKADGSMEAIPGGPADLKAGAEGQKRTTDANDVLGLLDEVDKLLPKSTGSIAGAGVDQVAGFFGKATDGAKATAQLKALQGALIGKMPKMAGPQSDKDVQLYREMAGQVADSMLPVETRQAAANTIRSLNEKYAGMQPGSSKPDAPKANLMQSLPKTAAKGTRARDTSTGQTLMFNGMSWVPEK